MHKRLEKNVVMAMWNKIKDQLDSEQQRIFEEIKNYPSPIAACDQHLTHLLEERERVSQELGRMHAVAEESLAHKNPVKVMDDFMRWSSCFDEESRQQVLSSPQDDKNPID